jgi:hypothetical protein
MRLFFKSPSFCTKKQAAPINRVGYKPRRSTDKAIQGAFFALDLVLAVGYVGSCVVITGREHSVSDPLDFHEAPLC